MAYLNSKLFTNETPGSFSAEEVLCPDSLNDVCVEILEIHFDRICLVLAIIVEANNGPRTLDGGSSFFDLGQEHPFDFALVDKGGKRISRVNESRAAGPGSGAVDAFTSRERVPECDIIDLCRLICHQLTF